LPKVSILIRTVDRPECLREALASCANQTHPNLEVVVVEDGPGRSRAVVEEFRGRLDIRYRATGNRVGRARAGNAALAEATGEWLNFLDDDDVLFADHVEVLVETALRQGTAGAYALAWETYTVQDERHPGRFDEVMHVTRHRQPFDRLTLWHHNYLPIQAVLFHRRLYERHGGFAEDMDQLEDWNLWTRYTLEDDFAFVEKTTSKYRVPAEAFAAAERQALLDRAYADALERQRTMRVTFSPREISEMADAYARSQTVVMVTRGDLRRLVRARPLVARLAAWRQPAQSGCGGAGCSASRPLRCRHQTSARKALVARSTSPPGVRSMKYAARPFPSASLWPSRGPRTKRAVASESAVAQSGPTTLTEVSACVTGSPRAGSISWQ